MTADNSRLGKGFDALMGSWQEPVEPEKPEELRKRGMELLPLDRIKPNPDQPRKDFREERIEELAQSIRQQGVLQPLLVEAQGEDYLLIAGERRFRAAQKAGLEEVPAIIREFTPSEKLEIALIENVQRENLNPIEEASAYRELMNELGLSQDEVARRVGKNRSTVANSLRLLLLPEVLQQRVVRGRLSAGHARAVLSLESEELQEHLADEIEGQGMSVRGAERRAKEMASEGADGGTGAAGDKEKTPRRESGRKQSPEMIDLEQQLIEKFGTKVTIAGDAKKGKIEISYLSMEDLERVLEILDLPPSY